MSRLLHASCLILTTAMAGALPTRGEDEPVMIPSMVALLSHPQDYEGDLIELKGYFGAGRTSVAPALFLSRDHAEIDDLSSAFFLTSESCGFIETHCSGHYVYLEARFIRRSGPENAGSDPSSFTIDDVTKVDVFKDGKRDSCWPPEKKGR